MPEVIRVLTADDSAVMRRLLHEIISSEADLYVSASAENGEQAISMFRNERPDVVLLDVEMPNINGVQAQRSIRAMDQRVPVLMFSPATNRGGELTLEALCGGASDFLVKPPESGHAQRVITALRTGLIPLIRYWGNQSRTRAATLSRQQQLQVESETSAKSESRTYGALEIVVIASPAWGVVALHEILSRLPGDFPVPVLVVQSLPPQFMTSLVARLDRISRLSVKQAQEGTIIRRGEICLTASDLKLVVDRTADQSLLKLSVQESSEKLIGGIDVLLRSVAREYTDRALVIMLNGRTPDGFAGCRQLQQSGAQILVHDSPGSAVSELPRLITQFGLADGSVSVDQLTATIRARLKSR